MKIPTVTDLVLLGDSRPITPGYFPEGNIPALEVITARRGIEFHSYAQHFTTVLEAARSGEPKLMDQMEQALPLIQSPATTFLTLSIGMNCSKLFLLILADSDRSIDSWYTTVQRRLDQFQDDLHKFLFRIADKAGYMADCAIIGYPPMVTNGGGNFTSPRHAELVRKSAERMNAILESAAKLYGWAYFSTWNVLDGHLLGDPVSGINHPTEPLDRCVALHENQLGVALFFNHMQSVLQDYLPLRLPVVV